MKSTRRNFIRTLIAGSVIPATAVPYASPLTPWHETLAKKARDISDGRALQILIPNGSRANIQAATSFFTKVSGISCVIEEVPTNDVNLELILRSNAGETSVDLALPASFGLADLVQANAIANLDEFAIRHEPEGFRDDYLYQTGDKFNDSTYGYQTDGDVYMLFYNKAMLDDPKEQAAYFELTGKNLEPATTWAELDSMMAFFHRPDQQQYGGALYRDPQYPIWEWWARFHATGSLPFTNSMKPNVNSAAGVDVLNQMMTATESLSPDVTSNGIFDNWKSYAQGNTFCNMGWGGTQKFLQTQDKMRDNVITSSLPGPSINGLPSTMGYFNWGWNYTVSSGSTQKELAYLLALFCTTPTVSTIAIREAEGFFDPFRASHHEDETVKSVYGASYLNAQKQSLENCVPDLYIRGQTSYLDVLRQQILATMNGEFSAKESLDICAQKWSHITRKLGTTEQRREWELLLASYPTQFQKERKG